MVFGGSDEKTIPARDLRSGLPFGPAKGGIVAMDLVFFMTLACPGKEDTMESEGFAVVTVAFDVEVILTRFSEPVFSVCGTGGDIFDAATCAAILLKADVMGFQLSRRCDHQRIGGRL